MKAIVVLLTFAFMHSLVAKPFGFDDWFTSQETRADIEDEVRKGEPLFAEQMNFLDEESKMNTQKPMPTTEKPMVTTMKPMMTTDDYKMTTDNYKMTTDNYMMTTDDYKMTTDDYKMTTDNYMMTTDNYMMTTDDYKMTTEHHRKDKEMPHMSLVKLVMNKMVKLYWSLHKIAKMAQMHQMRLQLQQKGVAMAPIQPPLLLSSTLLKLTQVQLADLYWSMKQLKDIASKDIPMLNFLQVKPTKSNKPKTEFFHGAEKEIAKLHWMMKYCTKYLEQAAKEHGLPSESPMTSPPPMASHPPPMTGKPPTPDPKHVVIYMAKMFEEAFKEVPKLMGVLKHITELTEEKEQAFMKHLEEMKKKKEGKM